MHDEKYRGIDLNKWSPHSVCIYLSRNSDYKLYVAENMIMYGGGFVKSLGECLVHADPINTYKICDAFLNYIVEYQPKYDKKIS